MGLRLEIVSRHRQSLGERGVKEFGPDGGTIGRSLESDWVLPDGQRFMSSRHASIDYRSGSYYVIDTSTNGVFINGATKPVGRGKPQRLFTNDRIRIGEYVMRVEIDETMSTGEHLADVPHIDPVDRAQRVESPDPTSYDLVDAFEITGVGIEMLLDEDEAATLNPGETVPHVTSEFDTSALSLEPSQPIATPRPPPDAVPAKAPAGRPPPSAAPAPPAARTQQPTRQRAAAAEPQPAQRQRQPAAKAKPPQRPAVDPAASAIRKRPQPADTASPAAADATPDGLLNAFLTGAGLAPRALDTRDAERMMHTLGSMLRETITGLTENLHLRSAQKGALRLPNTTIQKRDNNPLKFSAGVDEALGNLLFRESSEYLPPVESIRGAFANIKLHQQALLRAVYVAVDRYIERLDPDQVEQKYSNGRRGALMSATNKLKYWDFYKDLYLVVAQHRTGELPAQFLEELAQAYEQEIGRPAGDDDDASEPALQAGVG